MYRKIELRMWNDEKFKNLSPLPPSGQSLWIYLLTGPQTGIIPGLYRVGKAALAEELGWSTEDFEKAFQEVLREGLIEYSLKDRLVWIPKAIKYNMPQSPNVILSWRAALDELPECSLRNEAIDVLRTQIYALDDKGTAFHEAFNKVFGKPSEKPSAMPSPKPFEKAFEMPSVKASGKALGNQEQEQYQKQDQYQEQNNITTRESEREVAASPEASAAPPPAPQPTPPDQETPEPRGKFSNVFLAAKEYQDLCHDYGEAPLDREIELLSAHIQSTHKIYADHYATLTKWLIQDQVPKRQPDYYDMHPRDEEFTPEGRHAFTDALRAAARKLPEGLRCGLNVS